MLQQGFEFETGSEQVIQLAAGAYWLKGFAKTISDELSQTVLMHFRHYPPQTMMTPMGYPMSVKTSSCGSHGWVGTKNGYGYLPYNPITQAPWPPIPDNFLALAVRAASKVGYHHFEPDTCLLNYYAIGTKMGLHQDKDEKDFSQPIVSVSLGLPAVFLFGGAKRYDKTQKCLLTDGDVVVWGANSRRFYHGVNTIKSGRHAVLGEYRCNLTFRKAG